MMGFHWMELLALAVPAGIIALAIIGVLAWRRFTGRARDTSA